MSDTEAPVIDHLPIEQVMRLIPHRYPMLLLDRLDILATGARAIGYKAVTMGEPFFAGHFPGRPIMPGVLIVEALAQTAGAVTVHALGDQAQGKLVYFMSIEEAKFRRPVVPGDMLALHVEKERERGPVRRFKGRALVNDQLCAEATVTAMLGDRP
ncbi:MAG: 3-hydroxyacyl-ACP dehydratase FabZ [Pseudomonadota bacterium]